MNEDQENEILALESIRPEEFKRTISGFVVDIACQLPDGMQIFLTTNSETGETMRSRIEFLPPLKLAITLIDDYPEKSPPEYTISAPWLSEKALDSLQKGMQDLAEEYAGDVVVFPWTEHLREEALPSLLQGRSLHLDDLKSYQVSSFEHNTDKFLLSPHGSAMPFPFLGDEDTHTGGAGPSVTTLTGDPIPADTGDSGNAGESITDSPELREAFFRSLLNYDDACKDRQFCSDHHTCQICFDEKPGSMFFKAHIYCEHYLFCKSCLESHVNVIVRDGDMGRMQCPQPKCNQQLMPDLVKALVSSEDYDRYEAMTLDISLSAMQDVSRCPRCENVVINQDSMGHCMECQFYYCIECRQLWHGDKDCETLRNRIARVAKMTGVTMADLEADAPIEHLSAEDQNLVNELRTCISMRAMSNAMSIKQCPKCHVKIQKSGGCNKMSCYRCRTKFCWLCEDVIQDYNHFEQSGCVLFQAEDLLETENLENYVVDGGEIAHLVKACPNCNQLNAKADDNNRIICQRCHFFFCYLCLEPCFGDFHFDDQYGCKQYTNEAEDLEHPFGINYDGP